MKVQISRVEVFAGKDKATGTPNGKSWTKVQGLTEDGDVFSALVETPTPQLKEGGATLQFGPAREQGLFRVIGVKQ